MTPDGRDPIGGDGSGTVRELPVRLSEEGRVATWNPGLVRTTHVLLRVRTADRGLVERRSMNSGRARVRGAEVIESVVAVEGG